MDARKNLATGKVATPPSPASSGLSLTLEAGHGARFPAPPFNATTCPDGVAADPPNTEIVRVTGIAGDILTLVRAQEGTTARAITAGDLFFAPGVTKKTLDEVNLAPMTQAWLRPNGNGNTLAVSGMTTATLGTNSSKAWASTSALAAAKRHAWSTSAAANQSAGIRSNNAWWWRGNAPGLGGFHLAVRFGFEQLPVTRRWLVGMAAAMPAGDPSAEVNIVGIGQDAADTGVYFLYNDASGTATKVATGLAAVNTGEVWETHITCAPNGSSLQLTLQNVPGGTVFTHDTGSSTDVPGNAVGLLPVLFANTGTTAAAIEVALLSLLIETDI